jgi:hypothetical protein
MRIHAAAPENTAKAMPNESGATITVANRNNDY